MYKYRKISSTELKQNTRDVLKDVAAYPNDPTIIYTYKEPKAVLIDYERWKDLTEGKNKSKIEEKKSGTLLDRAKKGMASRGRIDSTKIIRELRDED